MGETEKVTNPETSAAGEVLPALPPGQQPLNAEAARDGEEQAIEQAAAAAMQAAARAVGAAAGSWPALPGVGIDLMTLGTLLARSGYFTDVKRISQAVVKILAGQELDIGPIRAMTEIHVVDGRIGLSASLMASLIKRSRRYDYRLRKHDEKECEIEFLQASLVEGAGGAAKMEPVGSSRFTMDDAVRAGLPKRSPSWHTYPRNMLFARALSNGARWYCADVFGGAVYTPEELGRPEQDEQIGEAAAVEAGGTAATAKT